MNAKTARLVMVPSLLVLTWMVYPLTYEFVDEYDLVVPAFSSEFDGHLMVTNVVMGVLFTIGWTAVWYHAVSWNVRRILKTVGAWGAAVLVAVGYYLAWWYVGDYWIDGLCLIFSFTVWLGSWMAASVFVWRETPVERARRRGNGMTLLGCPACGYDMRGARDGQCSECGEEFRLEELAAHWEGIGVASRED